MTLFRRNVSISKVIQFFSESCLIFGILYSVTCLRFLYYRGMDSLWWFDAYRSSLKAIVVLLVLQACMYLNEVYDYRITHARRELTIRLLQSLGAACILLSLIYLVWPGIGIGQTTFLISLPTIGLALFLWRQLYPRMLKSEALAEHVVILGDAPAGGKILEEMAGQMDSGYEIVALVTEKNPEEEPSQNHFLAQRVLSLKEFPQEAEAIVADRIVVAIEDRRGKMPFETLLKCRFRGIRVEEAASFYERLTGKILLDNIRPSWFIFSDGFRKSKLTLRVKRITDVVMAGILLVTAAPVMLLSAVLIKLDSKGPLIYKQDRVGEGWKDYTVYKFRSMIEDAETRGAQWAEKNDPRITRIGRVLRRYRIDELPQLFNVLKGDMSFVGPRPERRVFVEALEIAIAYYPYRLSVKPGITGWAQIKYHYGASTNETMEKLQYDLCYIKHMSFFFDLLIIFDTIRVVLTGKGAR